LATENGKASSAGKEHLAWPERFYLGATDLLLVVT